MLYVFVNSKNEFLKLHPKFIYHYTYFSEVTMYEEIEENDY